MSFEDNLNKLKDRIKGLFSQCLQQTTSKRLSQIPDAERIDQYFDAALSEWITKQGYAEPQISYPKAKFYEHKPTSLSIDSLNHLKIDKDQQLYTHPTKYYKRYADDFSASQAEDIYVQSENKDEYFNSCAIEIYRRVGDFSVLLWHSAYTTEFAGYWETLYDSGTINTTNLFTTIRFTPTNLIFFTLNASSDIEGKYRITFFFDNNFELLDEDDMASDSETAVASQQSILAKITTDILTHKGGASEHHAATIASDLLHNGLSGLNVGDNNKHLTDVQMAALHAATIASDLLHNELSGLNVGGNNKHLTDVQMAALHAATIASDLLHNELSGLNVGANNKHLTDVQMAALHAAVIASDLLHNELSGLNAGDINHLSDAQISALHAQLTNLTELATRNHNDLLNINAGTVYEHLSAAQVAALHAAVEAGDLSHNSLANLNAGTDYEHITQTQKDALHAATYITTGTYTGNGGNNREITGLGFTPKVVFLCMIWAAPPGDSYWYYIIDQETDWNSGIIDTSTRHSNRGRLIADGFEVNNEHVGDEYNVNGKVFNYLALG